MTILRDGAAASFVSEAAAATENEKPEARIRAAGAERAAAAAAAARASRRIHHGGDRILPRALTAIETSLTFNALPSCWMVSSNAYTSPGVRVALKL